MDIQSCKISATKDKPASRSGSAAPNACNYEFVRQCERALPKGAEVHRARIDAAGYHAKIINRFTSRGIGYAIRARLDQSVVEQTGALDESRRQPFIERDGTASEAQQTARFLHSMNGTPEAFAVIVRRRRKSGQQELELDCPQAGDTLSQGGYIYRALAPQPPETQNSIAAKNRCVPARCGLSLIFRPGSARRLLRLRCAGKPARHRRRKRRNLLAPRISVKNPPEKSLTRILGSWLNSASLSKRSAACGESSSRTASRR